MIALSVFFVACLVLFLSLFAFAYYPKAEQDEIVHKRHTAPLLSRLKPFKVVCYNVQFMAGKDYVFWFDVPDAKGPDKRPSPEAIGKTTAAVAKIIIDEDPDFIFLQEVDDGAKRSDKQDQLANLLALLPDTYAYHSSAFYWKSGFVPHPRIMGRAGMKLCILSKYPISTATRHQLALTPDNMIAKHLGLKRAVLEAHIPYQEGGELVLFNTHLEAFSKRSDTLQRQVNQINTLLLKLCQQHTPWVIGGDFNLLAPQQYDTIQASHRAYYSRTSEICTLSDQFGCVPST